MRNQNNQRMRRMAVALSVVFLGLNFFCFYSPVIAQDTNPGQRDKQPQAADADYSETELKKFIDANAEATKIQQENQQKMVSAIEEEGLDVESFNEIMSSHQDADSGNVSQAEMEKFNNAAKKVLEIQKEMQTEVVDAIEKTGMDVEKYTEILLAYQKSPNVQEKVHRLLGEEKE